MVLRQGRNQTSHNTGLPYAPGMSTNNDNGHNLVFWPVTLGARFGARTLSRSTLETNQTRALFLPQSRQRSQLLQIFSHRPRRSAPEGYALAAQDLIRQNAALPAQHHALFDPSMFANSNLPSQHDVVLDGDAA